MHRLPISQRSRNELGPWPLATVGSAMIGSPIPRAMIPVMGAP